MATEWGKVLGHKSTEEHLMELGVIILDKRSLRRDIITLKEVVNR